MNQFDEGQERARLIGFFGAIMNTMQNGRDNLHTTAAGYRDRIVHISLRPDEGGLNLAMPPRLISLLSDRGHRAGELLSGEFDFLSHVWARYRLTMCAIQNYLDALQRAWRNPLEQDRLGWAYINGEQEPPHYKGTQSLDDSLRTALDDLVEGVEKWKAELGEEQTFCKGNAPRPEPVLGSQPKF